MNSYANADRPGLLLFGPQTLQPSPRQLAHTRNTLLTEARLEPLLASIKSLPHFWREVRQTLGRHDDSLAQFPCDIAINWYQKWLDNENGNSCDEIPEGVPRNAILTPLTIAIHTVQYWDYLKLNGPSFQHSSVLSSAKNAGFQGQCIGFLTAIALSLAEDGSSLGENVAISFRLAFLIGVIVDLDWFSSEASDHFGYVVARSSEYRGIQSLIRFVEETCANAYASVLQDELTVTFAVPAADISHLIRCLKDHGYSATRMQLRGRYHSASHVKWSEVLAAYCQTNPMLHYPKEPQIPLRSNASAEAVQGCALHEIAIKSILVDICDWDKNLKACLSQVKGTGKPVVSFGLVDCISTFVANRYELQIIKMKDLSSATRTSPSLSDLGLDRTTLGIPSGEQSFAKERCYPHNAMAIIGMACRFPGADSIAELWDVVNSGHSLLRKVPEDRFRTTNLHRDRNTQKTYWGNFVNGIADFDHKFFNMSSREAASADPQQRFLLQTAYEALEDAGYFRYRSASKHGVEARVDTGCYVGCATSDYSENVALYPPTAYSSMGTLRAFLSGRISHYFGWNGPSITYDTACSSSMVAIHSACKALELGECSQALAGGVNMITSPTCYQNLQAASFLSPTGATKAFDSRADGYCRGEGVGLIMLKKLRNAIEDGDRIHGVITGTAINQSLNSCGPITAPDARSQEILFTKALSQADLSSKEVSFVEAHGTGTQLGDKIESESIGAVFGSTERELLNLGSIKANIGHTEGASGVAGLLKVLLMMRNRAIPPQANFSSLNHSISELGNVSIEVPTKLKEWKLPHLAACVNNYGAAGSNAVMIVEQSPEILREDCKSAGKEISRSFPLLISASSEASLRNYLRALHVNIKKELTSTKKPRMVWKEFIHNLNYKNNKNLPYIFTADVSDFENFEHHLSGEAKTGEGPIGGSQISRVPVDRKPVILAFGGQNGLSASLNGEIIDESRILYDHLQICHQTLRELSFKGIFPAISDLEAPQSLIDYHCILFALQYSLAKTWIDSGLHVDAVVGHSFGQLTALCISGCISLKDALKLVACRASLIEKHCHSDTGSMLAIEGPFDVVQHMLDTTSAKSTTEKLEIACYNGPSSFVVAGSALDIGVVEETVRETEELTASLRLKRLDNRCAFHSRLMDPILPDYLALAQEVQLSEPSLHFEACSDSCNWTKPSARLIVDHTRDPVYFSQAIERLSNRLGPCIWLEAGTGSPVIPMIRRTLGKAATEHTFLPVTIAKSDPWKSIRENTLKLWKANHIVHYWGLEFPSLSENADIEIPPYQFDRSQHWLDYIDTHASPLPDKHLEKTTSEPLYVSFIRFCDQESQIAEFQVNPNNKRFKLLIQGHAVLGIPLCPGSLYVDLAIESSLYLANGCCNSKTNEWIPDVSDLEMLAPLGYDAKSDIKVILSQDARDSHSWSFELSTLSWKGSETKPYSTKHATGHVSVRKRTDNNSSKYFASFERILDVEHSQSILKSQGDQCMRGPIIYNMFTKVIDYGAYYKGLRTVQSCGLETVGQVQLTSNEDREYLRGVCDPLELDNFLQVSGVYANCLREDMRDEAYVTTKIEGIHLGPAYVQNSPGSTSWLVYSRAKECSERLMMSDVFVFHAETRQLAMVILGAHFARVAIPSLLRVLNRVNAVEDGQRAKSQPFSENHLNDFGVQDKAQDRPSAQASARPAEKRHDSALMQLLSDILDVPKQSLTRSTIFADLSMDSLMATEILNEIRQEFNADVPVAEFSEVEDIQGLCDLLNIPWDDGENPEPSSTASSNLLVDQAATPRSNNSQDWFMVDQGPSEIEEYAVLDADNMQRSFDAIQPTFDDIARQTGFHRFWKDIFPSQSGLVVAYVAEAFAKLGNSLDDLKAGEELAPLNIKPAHRQLQTRLFEILKSAGLIELSEKGYVRTSTQRDTTHSDILYADLLERYPKYIPDHQMLHVTGPMLAECLSGKASAVDLIFGSEQAREILKNCYGETSIVRTANILLQHLMRDTFQNFPKDKKIRVLEIGAGTGGTTRLVMDALTQLGVNFAYDYTDISPSMVARARKAFAGYSSMTFRTLDVEKPPPSDVEKYHVIISTNCIHATSSLSESCAKMRAMLREDGVLALIEHTRNVPWFDLVFGLLDGWWKFEDGRKHALADELRWETALKKAGFAHVDWTDQKSRESHTIRLILGFATQPMVPSQPIHASNSLIHGVTEKFRGNLFTFPGGFGTGSTYAPLPTLKEEVAVYALNSPFLNCPEKFTVSLEELARIYVAEIRRIQPHGPYSIMGYSVGGVFAYEAVRQMIEEGEKIEQLFFIDSACPLLVPPMPLVLIDFFDSIDRFSGGQREVAEKKPMGTPHIEKTLACLKKYHPLPIPHQKAPPTVLFRVREGVDKQDKVPRPKVSAEDQVALDWILDDRIEEPGLLVGWEDLLGPANLSIVHVDGNHFSVMTKPYVNQLADEIRPRIKH